MDTNREPLKVTLAVRDEEARGLLAERVRAVDGLALAADHTRPFGLLVYEPGDDQDVELARLRKVLDTGQASDVILVGWDPDPDLLIRAMRAGVKEFLRLPVEEQDAAEALKRLSRNGNGTVHTAPARQPQADRGRVVAVVGARPGVGATTLAVNLAQAMDAFGPGDCALVDLQPSHGDIPYFLDLDYQYTWGDVVEAGDRLDGAFLQGMLARRDSGLAVLPAPEGGYGLTEPVVMARLMDELRAMHRAVVFDAPAATDEAAGQLYAQADAVVLALNLSLPCLARARDWLAAARESAPGLDERLHLVVLRGLKRPDIDLREAEDILGGRIAWTVPDAYASTLAAINQGRPLVELDPKDPASRVFEAMARSLAPVPHAGSSGWRAWPLLRLLFGRGGPRAADALGGAS